MTFPRPRDAMQATLALMLVVAFLGVGLALFHWAVPKGNRDLLTYMLGQLSGMVTTALAFYFATTKSSADKNRVIAEAVAERPSGSSDDPVHVDPSVDPFPRPRFGEGEN